jgi:hypothetical protein
MKIRWFKYVEPKDPQAEDWTPVEIVVSSAQILKTYYEYWAVRMRQKYQDRPHEAEAYINPTNCIDDWVVINWATEITDPHV